MALVRVDQDCVNGGASQPSVTSSSFTPALGSLVVILAGCYAATGDDISTITVADSLGSVFTPVEILSQLVDGAGALPPQPLAAWITTGNGVARTVTTAIQDGTGFSHVQGRFTYTGQHLTTPVPDSNAVRFDTSTASIALTSPVAGCEAVAIVTDWGNSTDVPVAEAGSTAQCALANADIQSSAVLYKALPGAGATTIGIQALAGPLGTLGIGLVIQPAASDEANATMDVVLPVPAADFDAEAPAAATMDTVLPVPEALFDVQAPAAATMDVVVPVLVADFDVIAPASATLTAVLPVPAADFTATAEAGAVMNVALPVPVADFDAAVIAAATMDVTLPVPEADFTADNEATSPDMFSAYADRLLACLCAQWPTGDPLKPARCCFRFDGDTPTMGIAMSEDECKCGSAWVRVVDWYPSSGNAFPGPTSAVDEQTCPLLWGLVLEMGIGRCPPTGDEKVLPSCDQLNAFHATVMDDGRRLRNAIYCCFLTVDPTDRVVVGQPERIGPSGKCFQQTLTVTVMVPNCSEC